MRERDTHGRPDASNEALGPRDADGLQDLNNARRPLSGRSFLLTTFQRYLIWRLFIASIFVTILILVPITMVSIFAEVPSSIIYSRAIWTILYGLIPRELYSALPAIVAISIVWQYDTLVFDHAVDALYSAGYSFLDVIAPAIVFAALSLPFGLFMSSVVAPKGTVALYDMIHAFEHRVRPYMLEERKFQKMEYRDRQTQYSIYFDRWVDQDTIEGVFVREVTPERELIVTAQSAKFIETSEETFLYFLHGIVQTVDKVGGSALTMTQFDQILKGTGLRGTDPPKRNWFDISELGPFEIFYAFGTYKNDPAKFLNVMAEVTKRVGSVFMTIAYVFIALGISLSGVGIRRASAGRQNLVFVGLAFNHAVIMLAANGLVLVDLRFLWGVSIVILAELIGGIMLMRSALHARPPSFPARFALGMARA